MLFLFLWVAQTVVTLWRAGDCGAISPFNRSGAIADFCSDDGSLWSSSLALQGFHGVDGSSSQQELWPYSF